MSTPPGDVRAAFTILLDEINASIDALNQENMRAIAERNYDKVIQLTERARAMDQFRERVNALQRDWQTIVQGVTHPGGPRPAPQQVRRRTRRKHGSDDPGAGARSPSTHLAKGLRTPEDAFRLPILRAIVQLGGSGKMQAVLDLVHEEMAPRLNHHDYVGTLSTPNEPRWKNNARWCRANMIKDGLLRSDSPPGLWEMSDEGRALVAQDANHAQPPPPPTASPEPPPRSASSNRSRGGIPRASGYETRSGNLAKGLRTPEDAYRAPILRALVQLGGSGRMTKVLELVHEEMAPRLNHHDYAGLASLPNVPRWKNSAQWCRAKLIEEGLLRSDSAHGVWAISDAGRAWLKAHPAAAPAPPPVARAAPPAPPAPPDDAADDLFDATVGDAIQSPIANADWSFIEQGLEPLPQLLEDVVMVFRLMHHGGLTYASAAGAVAARRGHATVTTIYDACTRRLGLTAAQFRDLVTTPTRLHARLAGYYPAFDAYLYELLVDTF